MQIANILNAFANVVNKSESAESGRQVSRLLNRKEFGELKGLKGAALKREHRDYVRSAQRDAFKAIRSAGLVHRISVSASGKSASVSLKAA